MTILNTTFAIDPPLEQEAVDWIARVYRGGAEKTAGASPRNVLVRVVSPASGADAAEGAPVCYALQIWFDSLETAVEWNGTVGSRLCRVVTSKWGEAVIPFTTYLEVLP